MARVGLTRARLIETAAELADKDGFYALTLAALARNFDVQVASLYSHVAGLEDLKTGVALHALSVLAGRTEEAVAGRAGRDALFALATIHREFAHEHPGLFEAARYRLDGEAAAASGGARLSRMIEAVLRGYALEGDGRVHATRFLGSFLLGFPLLETAGSFDHSRPGPEISWGECLEALDAALTRWASHA